MNEIIRIFKHIFIPHKHNGYKPHFFREVSIISLMLVAIGLFSISATTKFYINKTNMTATVLPAVLVDLTNNARVSNNQQTLARNTLLDTAANLKAQDMAKYGYFAHTSPQGVTPWVWFNKAGYTFVYAGENLAINFTESVNVEDAWLNSPTHKANILNNKFTEIGIATVDGIYQGNPTTYVVQMFGTPAFKATQAKVEATTTTVKPAVAPITKPKTTTPKVTPVTVAVAPVVKGESVSKDEKLDTLIDTQDFVAVRNVENDKIATENTEAPKHYSSWYDRLIFLTPAYADRIYHIIIWVVSFALLTMIVLEARRQHAKNILYGILLLVILMCLIYINRTMFVTTFLS